MRKTIKTLRLSLKFEKNYKNTETQPKLSGSYIKKLYYLLLHSTTFQGCFKIGRALPQLHKSYEIFYRSNSRWLAMFPSILEKAGFRYGATKIHLGQSEVLIQR